MCAVGESDVSEGDNVPLIGDAVLLLISQLRLCGYRTYGRVFMDQLLDLT